MRKKWILISIPSAFLAFTIWKAWPKVLPIPESEKPNLFGAEDYEKITGKVFVETALKNGEPYRYSETLSDRCTLRGLMKNGKMGGTVYRFVSSYQVCKNAEDVRMLFVGNSLMAKIPGIEREELRVGPNGGRAEVYSGNGTIYISSISNNVYYTLQIEPELGFDRNILVTLLSDRFAGLQSAFEKKGQ
jgi:hypothetical protein